MRVIQENKTYLAIDFKVPVRLDGSPDKARNLSSIGIKYEGNSFAKLPIVKAYIDNRLQKIRNQFDESTMATVFLFIDITVEKALRNTVEITIHLKDKQLYSEDEGEDLYSTINSVIEKIWKILSHLPN
ncbi:HPF/RaiA family ribosome-associated protein [Polynucleobacter sp. UK-FUSCHL-C3]|uniref:HPF/RaiA family ribosome-associated protein n=1 Tax=Polynucleobacter sp. UK-FUSCHL-C3 TaxID=2955208 RepID=A0AAU8A288_9BURK